MKLKKINAALGLLTILFMLLHMGYSVFAYLTFYYNPTLKTVFSAPFMVLVCLHSICGMLTVFMQKDGGRMDLYPKQNLSTVLQRVSAALIFPLLILHINTFSLMRTNAEKGQVFLILILIAAELIFFASIVTHSAVSLTKGLITLGLLSSAEKQKILNRIIYVIGAVFYVIAVYSVVKGQAAMFLMS